jgi:hypothetical protein
MQREQYIMVRSSNAALRGFLKQYRGSAGLTGNASAQQTPAFTLASSSTALMPRPQLLEHDAPLQGTRAELDTRIRQPSAQADACAAPLVLERPRLERGIELLKSRGRALKQERQKEGAGLAGCLSSERTASASKDDDEAFQTQGLEEANIAPAAELTDGDGRAWRWGAAQGDRAAAPGACWAAPPLLQGEAGAHASADEFEPELSEEDSDVSGSEDGDAMHMASGWTSDSGDEEVQSAGGWFGDV